MQGIKAIVGCLISIGGELLKALGAIDKPLHIIGGTVGVDKIEAAVGFGLFYLPSIVDLVQRQAVAVCVHGQLFAVGGGDGIDTVFESDRPDQVGGRIRNLAVGESDILTGAVIGAGGIGGHGLAAAGVIDHILAVCDQRGLGFHGVGEGGHVAVIHAILGGLDGEGGVRVDRDGGAIILPHIITGVVLDRRIWGGTGKGDLGALGDLTGSGGCGGSGDLHSGGLTVHIVPYQRGFEELEGVDRRVAAHAEYGEVAAVVLQILGIAVIVGGIRLDKIAALGSFQLEQGVFIGGIYQPHIGAVHKEVLAVGGGEGILVVGILGDGQHGGIGGRSGQFTAGHGGVSGYQFILGFASVFVGIFVAFHGHDLAVAGVVDQDLVAVLQIRGQRADILRHDIVGPIVEGGFLAVGHAVLGGLDGDGAGGRDGHRAGIVLICAVADLVLELCTLSSTFKGDGIADLDITGSGASGGGNLLECTAAGVELVDAGQQHALVGGGSVVQETGSIDVVQDAATLGISAGHGREIVFVNGDRPGSCAISGGVQCFGGFGI